MNNTSKLKKFFYFLKDSKKEIVIFIILTIIVTLISIFLPTINGVMINSLIELNYTNVLIFFLIFSALKTISVILNFISIKKFLNIRKQMVLNIRKYVCNIALNLNINVFQIYGQGNFLNKIQSDTGKISNYFTIIKDSLISIITSIGTLFVILFLNPIMGIYFLICCIISFFIRYIGIKKSLYYKKINLEKLDENSTVLSQIYKGAKDIKSLNLKKSFENKTTSNFESISDLEYKSNYYFDFSTKVASLMESIFLGGMFLLSILLIKNNLLTISTFIIILMNRGKVFNFTSKLSSLLNNYGQFKLSFDRILSLLEYDSEIYGNNKITNYKGNIEFKNISFSYDEKLLFNNLNIKFNKNEFTTIIGNNGSGKSTLFSLLTKFYNPSTGNIYLDKYDLNDLDEESIRDNISLVTQQPFLFNLSIKENLEIINPDFKEIKKVCKIVGLDEKIESLNNKYDSLLNEDATNFSGGEKQKLAIARVLLKNTKVLLFDEITNNLDKESINSINELINKLKGKYTIIMITHDTDLIKNSDRIIIMKNGKIIGDGNHKSLLKDNAYYQKINGLKN